MHVFGGKSIETGSMDTLRWSSVLHLSFIAALSVICLALSIFPAGVSAHTGLLRTDPANDAILRAAPVQARLWFSTVVSPEFSTAVVEDAAHEYVNTHDAPLSPGDAHEMDVQPTRTLSGAGRSPKSE